MSRELDSINAFWQKVVDFCRDNLSKDSFEIWVSPMRPIHYKDGVLTIEVPDRFYAQWLERHLKRQALNLLQKEEPALKEITCYWKEVPASTPNRLAALPTVAPSKESKDAAFFKPKLTFDHFVVGPTNRFAYSVCFAVAQSPGRQFNPVFVYGGTGLGKTHLLYAIRHHIQQTQPKLGVMYINSETFVNEFIDAIKNRGLETYRARYRNTACLLIDDIQFLVGKDQSEQEFFHTFNTLFESGRQIVMTSDRPPSDLQPVDSRLVSRFQWGVVADVKAPDFETRLAILRKKVETEGLSVPDEILQHLAQNIRSNIRVLEGSLKNFIAYSCLTGAPANLETVNQILAQTQQDAESKGEAVPSVAQIQEVVAKHYHVTVADLKDKDRSATKVMPRQIAMYLCRTMTNLAWDDIGRHFGGRDHSTVIYAHNKVQEMVQSSPFFSPTINKIEKEIRSLVDK